MEKFSMPRLSYNRSAHICTFDLETESLNLHLARPWQLAFNISQNGKIIKEVERYIWWSDLNVSKGAAIATRFDYSKYKRLAQPADEVFAEFAQYIYNPDYLLAGHNIISYDASILRGWALRVNQWKGWSFAERMIDTLCLSRIHNRGDKISAENFFADQVKEIGRPPRGAKKATLKAMGKSFGLEFDENALHDAGNDVRLNVKVLNKLIYALDI
jgi:DNA polymerase III epsilon subunit-like protein